MSRTITSPFNRISSPCTSKMGRTDRRGSRRQPEPIQYGRRRPAAPQRYLEPAAFLGAARSRGGQTQLKIHPEVSGNKCSYTPTVCCHLDVGAKRVRSSVRGISPTVSTSEKRDCSYFATRRFLETHIINFLGTASGKKEGHQQVISQHSLSWRGEIIRLLEVGIRAPGKHSSPGQTGRLAALGAGHRTHVTQEAGGGDRAEEPGTGGEREGRGHQSGCGQAAVSDSHCPDAPPPEVTARLAGPAPLGTTCGTGPIGGHGGDAGLRRPPGHTRTSAPQRDVYCLDYPFCCVQRRSCAALEAQQHSHVAMQISPKKNTKLLK